MKLVAKDYCVKGMLSILFYSESTCLLVQKTRQFFGDGGI